MRERERKRKCACVRVSVTRLFASLGLLNSHEMTKVNKGPSPTTIFPVDLGHLRNTLERGKNAMLSFWAAK